MSSKHFIHTLLLLSITLLAACIAPLPQTSLPQTVGQRDTLFQVATLSGLNAGDFDGAFTVGELRQHGDFGLGTFNALDGEMVVLGGEVYQMRDDGVPRLADDNTQTPFAAVTYFDVDQSVTVDAAVDCPDLQAQIDAALPALDAPYAIQVSGVYSYLQLRAPQAQSAPYPPTLSEALTTQALFESQNISGTLVGFRLPDYLAGANAAGYHFHFISGDQQHGGHVLACAGESLTVEIDTIDRIYLDVSPDAEEEQ